MKSHQQNQDQLCNQLSRKFKVLLFPTGCHSLGEVSRLSSLDWSLLKLSLNLRISSSNLLLVLFFSAIVLLYYRTNVDLKILLYALHQIKTIPWKFRILKPNNNSRVIHPLSLYFFLRSRLLLNILHRFCMFVNKYFIYLGRVYLKK